MSHAFACHNDLGRFCDEAIYQTDLALRLRTAGFDNPQTEVPLTVNQPQIELHLRRFLSLTSLRALQWINFNHCVLELVTLQNKGTSKAE